VEADASDGGPRAPAASRAKLAAAGALALCACAVFAARSGVGGETRADVSGAASFAEAPALGDFLGDKGKNVRGFGTFDKGKYIRSFDFDQPAGARLTLPSVGKTNGFDGKGESEGVVVSGGTTLGYIGETEKNIKENGGKNILDYEWRPKGDGKGPGEPAGFVDGAGRGSQVAANGLESEGVVVSGGTTMLKETGGKNIKASGGEKILEKAKGDGKGPDAAGFIGLESEG